MSNHTKNSSSLLCIGKIITAHGVKGAVKLALYSNNISLITDNILYNNTKSRHFKIKIQSLVKNIAIASIEQVNNREQALQLKNTEIYIERKNLPKLTQDDEFYNSDLIGMDVFKQHSNTDIRNLELFGKIKNIYNYGAGDIIEITTKDGKEVLLTFTKENFPYINAAENYIIVNLPLFEYATKQAKNIKNGPSAR